MSEGGHTKRWARCEAVMSILKTARPYGLTAAQIAARNGGSKAVIQRALTDLSKEGRVWKLVGEKRDGGELWAANDA